MNLASQLISEFAGTMCLVSLDKMHDKCIFATPSKLLYPLIDQVQLWQGSHLLGHFTSNCCGCLDTRLMMQPRIRDYIDVFIDTEK